MKRVPFCLFYTVCVVLWLSPAMAQQPPTEATVLVPRLIRFAVHLTDSAGNPLTGVSGITFALYREHEGASQPNIYYPAIQWRCASDTC